MSLYTIGDLHLSLGTNKPMDVFGGRWENYVQKLSEGFSQLNDDDLTVLCGDITWGMTMEEALPDFKFIDALPGKKIILKGNHDYWWSTRKKIETFLAEKGFDSIGVIHNSAVLADGMALCGTRGWLYNAESEEDVKIVNREVGRLNASIDDGIRQGGEPVVFLHYPPVYDGAECREILDTLVKRGIKTCYFGHIHGSQAARRAITGEYAGIKMVLISCDHLGFMPLLVRGA